MPKHSHTQAFEDFHEQYLRLWAYYLEVNSSPYRLAILKLSRELTLFQLMAIAEIYQKDATRLLVTYNTRYLSKYRKSLMTIVLEKASIMSWTELYESLVEGGVDNWTSGSYINWIDSLVKDKLIASPSTSRTEWLKLDEVKATRNLLAHNRGVVDNSYLKRTQEYYKLAGIVPPLLGHEKDVGYQYCYDAFECSLKVVASIDIEVKRVI